MNGYRTFIGLAIAAVPNIAALLGFDTAPGFGEQATEITEAIITIIGLGVALYGRLVATAPGWFAKKPE